MRRTAANDHPDHLAPTTVDDAPGNNQATTPPEPPTPPTPPQPVVRPTALFWIGPMTPDNRPAEFFGGGPGVEPIPPRNLSADEVSALTEAQWALIDSATGQRLYSATNPNPDPETTS